MAAEVERYIIELGTEGRLIEMQLEETVVGVMGERAALVRDYSVVDSEEQLERTLAELAALPHQELLDFGRLAELLGYDRKTSTHRLRGLAARIPGAVAGSRGCRAWWSRRSSTGSATSTRSSTRPRTSSRPSMASGPPGRGRSARVFAGFRRSTSSTAIREPDGRRARPSL